MIARRELIAALSGVAAWSLAARAQPSALPVIGFLSATSLDDYRVAAFRRGLNESGFVEGQNVAIEYRWAQGKPERLPELAEDLVARQVTVIAVVGSTNAALVVKAATSTIPIVFSVGADPVKFGLVTSLNRPGGNLTGVTFLVNLMSSKRLEILHQLVPAAAVIAFLGNPSNPTSEVGEVQEAARLLGHPLLTLNARTESEIEAAFATLVQQHARALIIAADAIFYDRRYQLGALAARHAVVVSYPLREYVAAGGLMSYGTSFADAVRQSGIYVGNILKGAQPHDLPVVQSARFELVINLRTARDLGLTIPDKLLALADEIID